MLPRAAARLTPAACANLVAVDKLYRLWQPRNPLFWMMLTFNALSSVCTWALRALPLNGAGMLLIGTIALFNVACGLWAMWRLIQTEPASPKESGLADASKPLI